MDKTILQLGSLEIYAPVSDGPHQFYWRDKHSPQGFGPFPSLYQAMKDHEKLLKLDKGNSGRVNNIINVDFMNKPKNNGGLA